MIMAGQLRRRSRYKGFTDDHGGTAEAAEPLQRVYRRSWRDSDGAVTNGLPMIMARRLRRRSRDDGCDNNCDSDGGSHYVSDTDDNDTDKRW